MGPSSRRRTEERAAFDRVLATDDYPVTWSRETSSEVLTTSA